MNICPYNLIKSFDFTISPGLLQAWIAFLAMRLFLVAKQHAQPTKQKMLLLGKENSISISLTVWLNSVKYESKSPTDRS